jgi:hypothetical protein
VPIFVVGEAPLAELGVGTIRSEADLAALRALLAPGTAGLVAFGTTEGVAAFVAAAGAPAEVIAVDAPAFADAEVVCAVDATIALPVLATGLAQRLPERSRAVTAPPDLVAVS